MYKQVFTGDVYKEMFAVSLCWPLSSFMPCLRDVWSNSIRDITPLREKPRPARGATAGVLVQSLLGQSAGVSAQVLSIESS